VSYFATASNFVEAIHVKLADEALVVGMVEVPGHNIRFEAGDIFDNKATELFCEVHHFLVLFFNNFYQAEKEISHWPLISEFFHILS